MKKRDIKLQTIGFILFSLLLVIAACWFWLTQMEQRWHWVFSPHPETNQHPMTIAETLLTQHHYQVSDKDSLSLALHALPAHGTLMLMNNNGNISRTQIQTILDWVSDGNTLIYRPKFSAIYTRPTAADTMPAESNSDETTSDAHLNEATQRNAPSEMIKHSQLMANDVVSVDSPKRPPLLTDTHEVQTPPEPIRKAPNSVQEITVTPRKAAQLQDDQIALYFGVKLKEIFVPILPAKREQKQPNSSPIKPQTKLEKTLNNRPQARYVEFEHADYPLQIWLSKRRLIAATRAEIKPASRTDSSGEVLRQYRHGRGKIVLLADHLFNNQNIAAFDHAELLLDLVQTPTQSHQIIIVHSLDATPWYKLLLGAIPYALISLIFLILLLTWRKMVRFGPLLPEPEQGRRALLEHIDASAKWLWQSALGQESLLNACRHDTLQMIQRRVPEILRLPVPERLQQLSSFTGISIEHLKLALLAVVAKQPRQFTLQIQTLQKLRQFYER